MTPPTASPSAPGRPRRPWGPSTGPSRRGRNQRGLASQQWLLVIAAVASFGALAVFVLTETVDDAVDRAGADDPARLATARHAARLVEIEAVTVTPANWPLHLWGEWEDYFDTKCQNIRNAFAAHGITVEEPEFRASSETNEADRRTEPIIMVTAGDPVVRTFTPGAQARLARADDTPPSATKPQAKCSVP